MTTSDPKLAAALVRNRTCASRSARSLASLTLLPQSPAERDDAGVAAMRKEIDIKRADHLKVSDIDRRFPTIPTDRPEATNRSADQRDIKPARDLLSFYLVAMRVSVGRSRKTVRPNSCCSERPGHRGQDQESCARR